LLSFSDDQLRVVISDLFIAGSETTSSTLRWAFLFMILYPDFQKKVQAEIDDVIGCERDPMSADRTKMPYTHAVLMEIQRVGSIVPFGVPHGNTSQDVQFEGYNIPRQTIVACNIWAVHHDATYWPYPESFNPKNFLDEKGNVIHRERLIPFLIGKRMNKNSHQLCHTPIGSAETRPCRRSPCPNGISLIPRRAFSRDWRKVPLAPLACHHIEMLLLQQGPDSRPLVFPVDSQLMPFCMAYCQSGED
jgi:hypothetical protein